MKALLIGLAFAFPPSALCADNLEYAIVTGVESLQRVRTASSLFPWDRAAPDEVLVSLSCGFVQVVYERVTTPKIARLDDDYKTRPWTAFVHLGHYCKLNEFVLDGWHLVAYRKWKGKDYLISYAEIRVGEDKRLYVDDSDFIEDTGLESLSGPAAQTSNSADCADSRPECTNRRIYLDNIPTGATDILAACAPMPAIVRSEQPQYPSTNPHVPAEVAVTIQFTIAPDGSVSDPVVLAAEPADVADWSDSVILDALKGFRFAPVSKRCIGKTKFVFKISQTEKRAQQLAGAHA
jgi:hypothetical protein